jgi:hypothetical protein
MGNFCGSKKAGSVCRPFLFPDYCSKPEKSSIRACFHKIKTSSQYPFVTERFSGKSGADA